METEKDRRKVRCLKRFIWTEQFYKVTLASILKFDILVWKIIKLFVSKNTYSDLLIRISYHAHCNSDKVFSCCMLNFYAVCRHSLINFPIDL